MSSSSSVAAVSPPASLPGAVPRRAHVRRAAFLWPIVLLVALCGVWGWPARVLAADAAEPPPPIQILPQDGFNLTVEDQINAHYVVVALTSPAHNWFAGTFTQLPTDQDVTIGLSLTGNDTKGNTADVRKWQGLAPVMTYADPAQYATYEWFQKDEKGRWVSGDPFKHGEAKYAGTSKVPEQSVIPADVAAQFLSADGTAWHAWREVDKAEAVANLNIFRITQRFAYPTATVAMRVPYTYTYLQAFLAKLQAAKLPGVYVDEIGETSEKRQLQVIRIEDPTGTVKVEDRQTVLMIAREHATEHASSWALHGALQAVLASGISTVQRQQITWLFVPIYDPDGSAQATFDALTDRFYKSNTPPTPPEVLAYARYVVDYIVAGSSLDTVVSLHNVEANETSHVFCPFRNGGAAQQVTDVNRAFYARLQAGGYRVGAPTECWNEGFMTLRWFGWCAMRFGAFDLTYEVNDRYPADRLSTARLSAIGGVLARELSIRSTADAGQAWHARVTTRLAAHRRQREAYLAERGSEAGRFTQHEVLNLGY